MIQRVNGWPVGFGLREMTTAQRDALVAADAALVRMIFNTDAGKVQVWNGTTWKTIAFE